MSGGEGRKISSQDLQMVQNRIEQCLKLYMSRKEAADALFIQNNIEPQITELVWQRLEEQNQEFFKAYYLKLMVKEQILEFNRLLTEQVELMRSTGFAGTVSLPMSNGSHISPMHQNSVRSSGENVGHALNSDDMNTPIASNLPNAFTNRGSTLDSCMPPAVGMFGQSRNMDVSSNLLLAQNTSMGMAPAVNGGIIGRNTATSFSYAAQNNFLRSHSAMADASMSSFSSVDSSLQPMNEPILDADDASFGFLGQISQNFGLSNLTADISSNSDMLESYSQAPFLATNTNNFLEPQGDVDRFQ